MSRAMNPYYTAPAGEYGAVGQGLTNLGAAFMNTPSASDVARSEALAWQARGAKQDQQFARDDRAALMTFANIIAESDPTSFDVPAVLAQGIRSGQKQGDLGQLLLNYMANTTGATDDQRAGALLGTGRPLGTDQAVSLDHQAQLLDRKAAADAKHTPMSTDQLLASIFMQQGPEQAGAARAVLKPGNPARDTTWLDNERRANIEMAVVEALDYLPKQLGADKGTAVPQGVYEYVVPQAMALVEQGMTPVAAVTQLTKNMNIRLNSDIPFVPFDSDSIEYDMPGNTTQETSPTAGAGAPPPPTERVPGQVYDTPRGPMVWVVTPNGQSGWMPAGA